MTNRQVRLAARPTGLPDASTWEYVDAEIPSAGPGEFVVKVEYLSLDPAMRGWLNDVKSYVPPVKLGSVMRAHASDASPNHSTPITRSGTSWPDPSALPSTAFPTVQTSLGSTNRSLPYRPGSALSVSPASLRISDYSTSES